MFRYEEYYLKEMFNHFIKKIWTLDNLDEDSTHLQKTILPNGCFNIAIIKGAGFLVTQLNQEKRLTEGIYFCGQATEAVFIDIFSHTRATMVQLYPWTPMHFFLEDINLFRDRIIPADHLPVKLDKDFMLLPDLENAQICRQILRTFSPLYNADEVSTLVTKASQFIFENHGQITVAELSKRMGCSARHLQKLFRKYIGLTPKELMIIVKLRESVDNIAYPDREQKSMTNLALVNQFYDQPHFNNTFQSIVRTSPKKFTPPDYLLSFKK